jgi:TatD DNase family protein
MTCTFIDSHAHLSGEELFPEVDLIIERAKASGIESILNICTDRPSLERGLKISEQYPWIYQAASTHPHDVEKEGEKLFPFMSEMARSGLLKAIGEIGLDYHYNLSSKESQHHFLRKYLHLALECRLPVVVHCREAFDDFFTILDSEYRIDSEISPGVLHCFTGTMNEAKEVLKRGWYLSLSGIVTFKKSIELHEIAKIVPLDRLLIETDSPFLAPQSKRGKKNEPSYVVEVAECIAQLRGVAVQEIAEATTANAKRLFKLGLL